MSEPLNGMPVPSGLPDTPCVRRAWVYASALSARYFGAPVFVVGGALIDPDPRDVDIVVPLDDELFVASYGERGDSATAWHNGARWTDPPRMWRRWARDCAKQSREMTLFCHRAIDFKTQPRSYFDELADLPRVRIDCGIMRD